MRSAITSVYFRSSNLQTGTTATIPLQPVALLSDRLASIADNWGLYRVTRLRFRLHPTGSLNTLSYVPGVTDTPPANLASNIEIEHCAILGSNEQMRTPWVVVDRVTLAGQLKWYKTVAGTTDALEEIQGNLFVANTASVNYFYEIDGICEFSSPLDNANTPDPLVRLAREKARLMKILASPDIVTASKTGK